MNYRINFRWITFSSMIVMMTIVSVSLLAGCSSARNLFNQNRVSPFETTPGNSGSSSRSAPPASSGSNARAAAPPESGSGTRVSAYSPAAGSDARGSDTRGSDTRPAAVPPPASNVALASHTTPLSGSGSREPAAHGQWLTSYDQAIQTAALTGRPILANFTGSDWCGFCIKLEKEVFATAEFERWASERFVLLQVDFPKRKQLAPELQQQNQRLKNRYEISGFPTVLILDASGSVLGKSGYVRGGPGAWIPATESSLR